MRSARDILIPALLVGLLLVSPLGQKAASGDPGPLAQVTGHVPSGSDPLDPAEPAEPADPVVADETDADSALGAISAPPLGSRARQLTLKFRLLRESTGVSLASSLDHNRQEWQMLSPDQRDQFRATAVAFLKKNPTEQDKLLEHYARFIEMSEPKRRAYQRRADWLRAVVETLSPAEREELESLPLRQRAQRLILLRDRLIREGKLELAPAQPVEEPTAPAGEPNALGE